MQLSSRSDEELVALARRGWPAPFAVLVQRHGATVRAAAADRSDPNAAVVRTFTRAMQQLKRVDPATPVESWLLALVPGRHGRTAAPGASPVALDGSQLDALWAELAPRWPRGRAPRRLPTWLRWSLLTLLLMALATVIPYATITTGQRGATPEPTSEPLRAALIEPDVEPGDGPDDASDGTDEDSSGGVAGAAEDTTGGVEGAADTTNDGTGGGFDGAADTSDDRTAGGFDGADDATNDDAGDGFDGAAGPNGDAPDDATPDPAAPGAPATGENAP